MIRTTGRSASSLSVAGRTTTASSPVSSSTSVPMGMIPTQVTKCLRSAGSNDVPALPSMKRSTAGGGSGSRRYTRAEVIAS